LEFSGKLGDELTIEEGCESFRLSTLNAIAELKSVAGELSRIERIVRVEGVVQTVDGYTQQPQALDGASHLINKVFAEEGAIHA